MATPGNVSSGTHLARDNGRRRVREGIYGGGGGDIRDWTYPPLSPRPPPNPSLQAKRQVLRGLPRWSVPSLNPVPDGELPGLRGARGIGWSSCGSPVYARDLSSVGRLLEARHSGSCPFALGCSSSGTRRIRTRIRVPHRSSRYLSAPYALQTTFSSPPASQFCQARVADDFFCRFLFLFFDFSVVLLGKV